MFFTRVRYYSADAGVFLSTDPVKHIGPGWRPVAYGYAQGNPLSFADPKGEIAPLLAVIILGAFDAGLIDFNWQLAWHGRTLSEIDWPSVVGAEVKGALSAPLSFAGSSLGLGAQLTAYRSTLLSSVSGLTTGGLVDAVGEGVKNTLSGGSFGSGFDANRFKQQTLVGMLSPFAGSALSGILPWNASEGVRDTVCELGKITSEKMGDTFFQNSSAGGSSNNGQQSPGSSPNQSVVSRAPGAGSYAQGLNDGQQSNPAPNSTGTGSMTQTVGNGAGNSGSGNNAFNKIITSIAQSPIYQTVTTAVQNAPSKVSQAITSAVQTVSSWASSAWSFITGGRP